MADAGGLLSRISVLELSQGIAGAYCGKLLAGLGARVIKVEPPAGDPLRALPPFAGDIPDRERGAAFLYLNTAKQSITLDLTSPEGVQLLHRLVESADVLIESFAPGTLARQGLDAVALAALNPRLIVASLTPFGQSGPYRDYRSNELIAEAVGGLLYTIGLPEREPLKMGGNPVLYAAGAAAFSAIMAALWQRDTTGSGQAIDISLQEVAAATQIHSSIEATWQLTNLERRPNTLLEARDGWVSAGLETGVAAETWPRFCALIGRPELADDERFSTAAARREHRDETLQLIRDWVQDQPKEEVYHRLQALRTIAGYVATTEDLFHSRQLQARAFFTEIDHPIAGAARYPGPPFRIDAQPWMHGHAPLLGEHNDSVYVRELGLSCDELRQLQDQGVV